MVLKRTKSEILRSNKIDKKLYIRWINNKIKQNNNFITDIQFDLSDGLILIELIEILTQKKLEFIKRFPEDRSNRIYTLNNIFIFLQNEGLLLKNIEPAEIVDGSIKKIKEFLWEFIFHYSIKKFIPGNNFVEIEKNFLKWINSRIDGYFINDFSTAWNSGIAIGMIVHTCDNDICTDVLKWKPTNALNNARFAMEAALQCFSIPQLIKPNEIIDYVISAKAIMIYISQFASLIQEKNNNKYDQTGKFLTSVIDDDGNTSMMLAAISADNSVRPQVDYEIIITDIASNIKNNRVDILIRSINEKIDGKNLIVEAVDKDGIVLNCSRNQNYSKSNELLFSFIPNLSETYDIILRYENNKNILNKPFRINVESQIKQDEIVAYGPGLSLSVCECPGIFILETGRSDKQIGFSLEGPSKTKIDCEDIGNGTVKITYFATVPGTYQLSITANENDIYGSPFSINIIQSEVIREINKIKVIGLHSASIKSFVIDSRDAKLEKSLDVKCFTKLGYNLENITIKEIEDKFYQVKFLKSNVDSFIVFAGYCNIQIQGFPFLIKQLKMDDERKNVERFSNSSSMQERCFEILNQDLIEAIELSIQDLCLDTITDCLVNSKIDKITKINDSSNFEICKWIDKKFGFILNGIILNGEPIKTGSRQIIKLDISRSIRDGSIGFILEGPMKTEVDCFDKGDGIYIIQFQPVTSGKYELTIKLDDQPIDGSPFIIIVMDTIEKIDSQRTQCMIIDNFGSKEQIPSQMNKLGNTPTNCDVSSFSSIVFNCKNETSKSIDHVSKSKQDDVDKKLTGESNLVCNNPEIESHLSSSNTSGNSIPSGIYKARIRKLSLFTKRDLFTSDYSTFRRSKSENGNESSISSSTSMEIERISQNYHESILSFYENLLSAFTNLSIIDIIYFVVEQIINKLLSNPIQVSSYKDIRVNEQFRNSLNTDFSLTYLSENNFKCSSKNTKHLRSLSNDKIHLKFGESQTLSQITTPIELKCFKSYKHNSMNSLINSFSEKSLTKYSTKTLKRNLISSFEIVNHDFSKDFFNSSEENRFYISRSKYLESFYENSTICNSTEPITLTPNTEFCLDQCCKSVGVDIASSSISSNQINNKVSVVKCTDAEVMFDSSNIESKRTSDYLSVYDKILSKNFSLQDDTSIDLSKISIYNSKHARSFKENSTSDQTITNYEDGFFSTKQFVPSPAKKSRLSLKYENENDENFLSCHSIDFPIEIQGKMEKSRNHCLIIEKQSTETSKTESVVDYSLLKNVKNQINNPKYFIEKLNIHYEENNDNTASNVSIFEKHVLLSTSFIRKFPIKEEVEFFVNNEDFEKQLESVICLEYSKTQNLANVSMVLPNCHQFKCPNPILIKKNSQTTEISMKSTNLENMIYMDIIHFYISKYVKEYLTKRKEDIKKENIIKHAEKSAQTCSSLIDKLSSKVFSKTNIFYQNKMKSLKNSEYHLLKNEASELFSQDWDPQLSSNESQDISSAVETLVDAITDIAKNHLLLHPSKSNIKRVEELLKLLPRLLEFGKEKRLYHINYLTDKLESILLKNNDQNSNKALSQIIKSIKSCVFLGTHNSKNTQPIKSVFKKLNNFSELKINEINKEKMNETIKFDDDKQITNEIYVFGKALFDGFVNFDNKFVVHTSGKTPGNLAICIEGPSKADISFMEKEIGIYIVCYKVTISGEYLCSISFNKVDIQRSPFRITIVDNIDEKGHHNEKYSSNWSPINNKPLNSEINNAIGRNLMFHIYCKELSNLNCFITEPLGGCSFVPIKQMSKNSSKDGVINLFASQIGVHNIEFYNISGEKICRSWKLNIENINGYLKSLLIQNNGEMNEDNQMNGLKLTEIHQNICPYGKGLQQARVCQKNFFFIYVGNYSENMVCKEPSLDVTIDGPSKVKISCAEDSNGYIFCYIPVVTGIYFIGIKYSNEYHIPGSPFKIVVTSSTKSVAE